jgi:DNA-binding transcriptional ArsR family regulator
MSLTNPLGDIPITDPQAMRALAHPVRLAVLMHLQRNGPATATALSPHVGATPSVTSWHLRHLATFGLVIDAPADEVPGDRRQRWWKAVARGFRFEPTGDPAAEMLADQMYAMSREQVDRWMSETRPQLTLDWLRVSGLSNTAVRLTLDELSTLAGRIDELLAPFVHRDADAPADARPVRILRHYMPALPPAES